MKASSKSHLQLDAFSKRLQKIHILLLDSSSQITSLFEKMLNELGFTNIYAAHNGFQGVQILRKTKIHLIITDWELKIFGNQPDADNVISHMDILPLSGVDFVKRLRQSPSSPNPFIPVIMFADAVEKMRGFSARDAGVNEICIKPLNARQLCERIIAIIQTPRLFITADSYKGPCRRRESIPLPATQQERRIREIRIIKNNELT